MSELRVVIQEECDPTHPDDWGWSPEETAGYMAKIESGEFVVVWAQVQAKCDQGEWHGSLDGVCLPSLSDIHVPSSDLSALEDGVVTGPAEQGSNYLRVVAFQLLGEHFA